MQPRHSDRMTDMRDNCDLCNSNGLELAYRPPTGQRGLAVFVCRDCGLVQSLPRVDHVPHRNVAVSSGADWGNVRYGKAFRTDYAISRLREALNLSDVHDCLDLGSNRGSFVLRLRDLAPRATISAIEPDGNIVANYGRASGIELVVARIEDVDLPKGRFELVHCSHTLEHLRSPRDTLRQIRRAMRPDGVLFVEVPNLRFIGRDDVLEEWFIDKHLYHFSQPVLRRYLQLSGFAVDDGLSECDDENISLIARAIPCGDVASDSGSIDEASSSRDLISRYQATVCRNHSALHNVARRIESFGPRRVAAWGAGRILDSLVRYGDLNVSVLVGVVDKYLREFTTTVHGCTLIRPNELSHLKPEIVLIASREYFEEIRRELASLVPAAEAVGIADLLREALQDAR